MRTWIALVTLTLVVTATGCAGISEKEREEKMTAISVALDGFLLDSAGMYAEEGIPFTSREVKPAQIGDDFPLRSEDATVSIDAMLWHDGLVPSTLGDNPVSYVPTIGYKFLVVTFTITNGSEGDIDPSGILPILILEDDLGRQRLGTTGLANDSVYKEKWDVTVANIVRSGRTGRGIMLFDADPSSPGLVLRSDILGFEIPVSDGSS